MKKTLRIIVLLMAVIMILPSCASEGITIMEYEGKKLDETMYAYWLSNFKRNILNYYSDVTDTEEFWNSEYDGEITVEDYFSDIINNQIKNYLIAQHLFKKYNLKLSEEVKIAIKADINEKIEYYGSRAELNAELATIGLNIDTLEKIYTWEEMHDAVYQHLYGKNGIEQASEEQIIDYYEKNYSRMLYVVIFKEKLVVNEKGEYQYDSLGNVKTEPLSEEELKEKEALISDIYNKAVSGEDFVKLMEEHSDYDISAYSSGLFLSGNEIDIYGPEITEAVMKAAPGDVFRVDEEYAVYIIKKYELTDFKSLKDKDIEQISGIESYCVGEIYAEKFGELAKDVKINEEVFSQYKLSEIKANPYLTI